MNLVNVAVLSKCFKDEILNIMSEIMLLILKHDFNVVMLSESSKYFSGKDIIFLNNLDDVMQKSDIIFVVGGDGTLIYYAKQAAKWGKKVFGINGGNLGFLCGCEGSEIGKLNSILDGNYNIKQCTMLEIDINGKTFTALNDIVFSRDINSSVLKYSIRKGDDVIAVYEADGVIFATPIGSTAYSFSAGGAIVENDMECMVMTPICPHNFFSRSMILGVNEEIDVDVRKQSDKSSKFYASIDGIVVSSDECDVNSFRIKRSKYCAKMINLKEKSFYGNIEKKLFNKAF